MKSFLIDELASLVSGISRISDVGRFWKAWHLDSVAGILVCVAAAVHLALDSIQLRELGAAEGAPSMRQDNTYAAA